MICNPKTFSYLLRCVFSCETKAHFVTMIDWIVKLYNQFAITKPEYKCLLETCAEKYDLRKNGDEPLLIPD